MPVSDESRITVICNPSHRLLTHPSHGLLLAARHRVMSPRLGPSIDSVYRVCIECVSSVYRHSFGPSKHGSRLNRASRLPWISPLFGAPVSVDSLNPPGVANDPEDLASWI